MTINILEYGRKKTVEIIENKHKEYKNIIIKYVSLNSGLKKNILNRKKQLIITTTT